MRKIAIAAAVSLSLSGVTGISHALGLGEIEMYSALNQSLDAEIAILSATDDELQNMQVRLAPSDAFARAGLEQLPILSSVVFAVDRRPDGKAVVKVTSDGPVLEPFLNFLIEVDAPGSVKLVREYTVLLNPTSPLTRSSSQPATTFTDDQIFVGNDSAISQSAVSQSAISQSAGAGVEIDLSSAAIVGTDASTPAVVDTFAGNDTGGEVIFTETTTGGFTVPVADTSAVDTVADTLLVESETEETLFVPDEQIFANTGSGSSVVGSDGQLISLEQELNTTPQFDEPVVSTGSVGGEAIELADSGESLSLDNLGAQGEPADNAIFGNEFEAADSGELIVGDELRDLVGDVATSSQPTVEFTETVQAQASAVAESQPVVNQDLVVTDISSTFADTDAGAGDLIDLSGIIDDSAANTQPVEDVVSNTVSTDGIIVEVENSGQSAAVSQNIELSGNTYRIQSSDTLWSISNAQKARGVTPHQMMVALLDANPNAFVGGNMNRLVNGAVLQIPTAASQNSFEPASSLAIVQSWTRDNKPPSGIVTRTVTNVVQPVVVTDNNDTDIVINDLATSSTLTRDLEDVNTRYEQARDELAAETKQRDELQGRVNNLTDNMEQMKTLITVRENELTELQNEVTSAENDAAEIDAQISKLSDASEGVADMQDGLNKDLAEAQDAIERQADLEKNLASAEAEAQSARLSSEEDSLRAQLAALEIEKRDFEATSQLEKAELVRQSEAEKTRLLAQAKAEREKIMGELDVEKARITREAEMEVARIKGEAATESQRVATEAQAERERLAAETAAMQAQLEEMESEKNRLMAEAETKTAEMQAEADAQAKLAAQAEAEAEAQAKLTAEAEAEAAKASEESARVKDRLAAMKKEADEKAAAAQAALADAKTDTDADGMMGNAVDKVTDTGKNMAAGGAAAVGGLLGFAPLQEMIGNRKNVLAAGAGLSLLGLLASWGLRRRKYAETKEVQGLRPRGDASRVAAPDSRTKYEQEQAMYGDDPSMQPQQRTDNRGTAAAAAAAAAVTGTAAAAASRNNAPAEPQPVQPAQPAVQQTAQPAPAATPAAGTPAKPTDAELEEVALDDTITEAEVYLRYGLHGQAEDLLKTAIDRSPDNEEYHFKLLENYHDQKNAGDFNKAAATFNQKFPASDHAARVSEMGAELGSSGGTTAAGAAGAVAGAGALAAGSLASFKGSAADNRTQLDTGSTESDVEDLLDQTIDPGTEFSVDELQATGNLNAMVDDVTDLDDQGGMSLDDVDLASFDDDGTMNLEEVAGSQMSGGDLGSLDLTNPVDGALDNLTLDDADLNAGSNNSMGDNVRSGLAAADLPGQSPIAGGTDEMETMLDLAKAYIDMGDNENASKALKDIAARGNPLQQTEANELLKKLT